MARVQKQRSAMDKQTGEKLYQGGEIVEYSGEYVLVDARGNVVQGDFISLDEGETFPTIQGENLCYRMNATCLDEVCEDPSGQSTKER